MTSVARLILALVTNLAAVMVAAYFIPEAEFQLVANAQGLLPLVATLTVINLLLRPILKMILSPLIFITLGLFTLIINTAILYFIDISSASLTINGLLPLIKATAIISFANLVINHAALFLYRRPELS